MKITLDWGLTNLSRGRPHNWERNAKHSSFIAKKKTGLNRTNMETHVSYDVHGNHQLRKKEDDFQNWISQILRTNSMSHQFITHRIHFFILCFQHDECHYIFTIKRKLPAAVPLNKAFILYYSKWKMHFCIMMKQWVSA